MANTGIVGLAVMGRSLALNLAEKGIEVIAYSIDAAERAAFAALGAKNTSVAHTLEEFISALERPRRVIMLIRADAADAFIEEIVPLLDEEDVLIDMGNSNYIETEERAKRNRKVRFMGVGISGGEQGARHGACIMAGGDSSAYTDARDIFKAACAKVGNEDCEAYFGEGGAGHFVKTVHNGIEYAELQLIAEIFGLLKGAVCSYEEMAETFEAWSREDGAYLTEITAAILRHKTDGVPTVELISDVAGQKGTGAWSSVHALEMGIPFTSAAEAVMARYLTANISLRRRAARIYSKPKADIDTKTVKGAFFAAKRIIYAQGFELIEKAKKEFKREGGAKEAAHIFRGGCIIRCALLKEIAAAYEAGAEQLLVYKPYAEVLKENISDLRKTAAAGIMAGIPLPVLSSALAYLDGISSERLPSALIQAERDCFGAHGWTDGAGKVHHTNWLFKGDI